MEIKCEYSELVEIEKLVENPKNPNTHSVKQIEILAKNILHQGFRHPIIVSKRSGFIAAGHGRLSAARILDMEKVPVDYQDFENEADEFRFMVADNKIASLAVHDDSLMIEGIKDLELIDTDFELLGLDDFLMPLEEDPEKDEIEDDVPDVADNELGVELGDIYQLGEHRLMCGDSTDEETVSKLMNGDKVDMSFTSPPYNAGCFGFDNGKSKYKKKGDDNRSEENYFNFLTKFTDLCLENSKILFFNNQFLSGNRKALARFIGHYSDEFKEIFPWIKNTAPPNVNKGVFTNRFEIFLALEKGNTKKGFDVSWQGKFHNIIEGSTAAKENVTKGTHSATMPIYLPLWFFERLDYLKTCYDPFMGSGTTLIACEKTNRKCYGMELDPHYCSVIIKRWEKYSGKTAKKIN